MPSIPISVSASGDTVLIASPGAGKFIRVQGFTLMGAGSLDVTLKSASTTKAGPYPVTAGGGLAREGPPPDGIMFDCGIAEALNITLSAATRVSGDLQYVICG